MSPIIGMTDNAIPQFPRIGKLRKGAPKPTSSNAPGRDLSYFRFTSDNPRVEAAFKEVYGDEPQELSVYLPFASVEDCFPTWRERWTTVLQHRCDGEVCTRWLQDNGQYCEDPVPCPGGCTQVGRLNVILPELLRAGYMGLVTMETHSIHDIVNIHKTLLATIQANPDKVLTGVGFWLRRAQREISTPGEDGKRIRRKKWMVVLQPVAAWVLAQIEAADILLQIEGGENGEDDEVLDADYEDSDEAPNNQQSYPHAPEPTKKATTDKKQPPEQTTTAKKAPAQKTGPTWWGNNPELKGRVLLRQQELKITNNEALLALGMACGKTVTKVSEFPGTWEAVIAAYEEAARVKARGGQERIPF